MSRMHTRSQFALKATFDVLAHAEAGGVDCCKQATCRPPQQCLTNYQLQLAQAVPLLPRRPVALT